MKIGAVQLVFIPEGRGGRFIRVYVPPYERPESACLPGNLQVWIWIAAHGGGLQNINPADHGYWTAGGGDRSLRVSRSRQDNPSAELGAQDLTVAGNPS